MSLIDLASLVLAPTAVKDGKVYNAIPNDQDFTFSRGTEATRVNSAGLIEKARTNFLLQSNTFDTTWQKYLTTLTSGQTGYDGSINAWLLDKSASGFANIYQSVSTSGVLTASVYAKAGTNSTIILRCIGGTDAQGFFDLSNGTIEAPSANCIDAQINAVGNGWYRCSITFNTSSTTSVNIYPEYPFAGTTSGNILIQDAQLEQGLVSTDVITTTTSSVTVGVTDDLPRVDYSGGGCPSLLLEPSRTNLVTNSEYVNSSDYVTGNWSGTITTNTSEILSPEGLHNATKFVKSGSTDRVYFQTSVSDGTYTGSMYFKAVSGQEGNTIEISVRRFGGGSGATTKLITLSSEWQRVDVTATLSGGTNTAIYIADFSSSGNANSFYFYGLQLEQNASYVSSYIPTYGTSTSRSADSCSLTNASNLIGQSEGTLFVEADLTDVESSVTRGIAELNDTGTFNRITLFRNSNGTIRLFVRDGGVTQMDETYSTAPSGKTKIGIGYANNDIVFYVNGTQVASDTSASIPQCSDFDIGVMEGNLTKVLGDGIKQAILFPTRLTNDQLQEITK